MKVIKHYIYGFIISNHLFEKKNILENCKLALIYHKNDNYTVVARFKDGLNS
jgi:hypothetical protein